MEGAHPDREIPPEYVILDVDASDTDFSTDHDDQSHSEEDHDRDQQPKRVILFSQMTEPPDRDED